MNNAKSNMPALGAAIRHEWPLDPQWLTVNHGSFGATPHVVTEAQDAWRRRLEEQPSRFMRRVLPDALRNEFGHGFGVLEEAWAGAREFAGGKGRHGSF